MKKTLYTHLSLAIMATITLLCACQDFEALDERPVLDTPPTVESVTPRSIVVSRPLPVHDRYLGDGRGRAFIISTNPEMNGRYGNGTYNGYDDTFYGVFDGLRPHTDYYIQYIEGCTCADRDTTVLVASPITKVTTLAYDPVSYQLRLGSGFTKGLSDILGVFSPHGGGYTYETLIYSKDWMTPKTTIDDERPVYIIYPAPSAASQPESVPVSYTGQTLWLGAQTISPENPSATVSMQPYSANVTLNVTYKAASTGTSCTLRGGAIENVTSGGPISTTGTLDMTNGQFTATDGGKNQGYSWPGGSARITNGQKNTTTLTGVFPVTFADGQVQVRLQYDGNLENPEATVALPASTWKQGGSYTYNIEAQFSATGVTLSIVDVTIEEWGEGERLENVIVDKELLPLTKDIETFEVNGVKFNMIKVEAGTFQMGKSANGNDKTPVHTVTLSQDYYIGEIEVTQALWEEVLETNWSFNDGDNYPAYSISYNDVQFFITKLNQKTGRQFRMPTEAEWEYAAKGGKKSKGYIYSGSNTIDDVAWYESNSDLKAHLVKTKSPNELGIYDMSGNVWEWCYDWYESYSSAAVTDPTGPKSGSHRVARGGCWINSIAYTPVVRNNLLPTIRGESIGFRLALSPSK